MNAKKTKEKERRRARKLAEEAWEAADAGNLDLAEKLIRRAVATQIDNPVLWNDQGMVLVLCGKEMEAEEAFRAAISLAPTYAEPFARLAALRARDGYLRDAVRLLEKAVQFAPQPALFAERLDAYRALLASQDESAARAETDPERTPAAASSPWEERLRPVVAARDWDALGRQLTAAGCVRIPALLDAPTCETLRRMFDDDALFAKTVTMDRDGFGKGAYRYFRAPVPDLVAGLRRAVYPHVASIANEWQQFLNLAERYPEGWEAFRQQCHAAGQATPTPILLRYGPGGFNALHRDLRGSVFFPIQLAVVLSPLLETPEQAAGFRGGEFLFCDVPEGKKALRREVAAGLGDALLFCTRDRLVRVGGAYGLQPVKHGVNEVSAGSRLVLGVPFHDYR